jgi:hypothetical protein
MSGIPSYDNNPPHHRTIRGGKMHDILSEIKNFPFGRDDNADSSISLLLKYYNKYTPDWNATCEESTAPTRKCILIGYNTDGISNKL